MTTAQKFNTTYENKFKSLRPFLHLTARGNEDPFDGLGHRHIERPRYSTERAGRSHAQFWCVRHCSFTSFQNNKTTCQW